MLPQWHVQDPGHSAKKCRWQVTPKHAYTHDPIDSEWADYAAAPAQCGNLSGNELTHNLSSQLTKPLWTGPGIKSGISVRELISTKKKKERKKKKKNAGGELCSNTSPQILASEEKATTTTTTTSTDSADKTGSQRQQ